MHLALIFEQILTKGVAELPYLVGDDQEGVAAVVDPRIDIECYLELARKKRVPIIHTSVTTVTYSATGYRASLAASILKNAGFKKVLNLPGSFTAWKNANLPIEEESDKKQE